MDEDKLVLPLNCISDDNLRPVVGAGRVQQAVKGSLWQLDVAVASGRGSMQQVQQCHKHAECLAARSHAGCGQMGSLTLSAQISISSQLSASSFGRLL